MKKIFANKILISALFVVLLFVIFLFLCRPIINYDEDFFVLYTLAGGFGSPPTNLLHYYYGWNPFLLWPVARLFGLYPAFNWYTFFLLILQLISCIYLLNLFFLMFRKTVAIVVFMVFFLFFESQFLQSLNYSNTSFILSLSGAAGFMLCFIDTSRPSTQKKKLIVPFLLALAGGLLRVHTLGLTILLSIEIGLVLLRFYNLKRFIFLWFVLLSVLLIFIFAHNYYYQARIPGSKQEEKFRQSAFYIANHPQIPGQDTGIAQIKSSFIHAGFLYDTSFIAIKDLEAYSSNKNHSLLSQNNLRLILYWTLINNRVYLLLIGIILIFFITSKNAKAFGQWLTILLSVFLTFTILFLFFKVTAGIFIIIIASMFLASVFLLQKIKQTSTPLQRFALALLVLACLWMLVRIKKTNDEFVREIENTRGMLDELNSHKTILFVFTNEFNDHGFYIWDTPHQRPALNLLNGELMTTDTYGPILKRFQINNIMESLPDKSNVMVAGTNLPLLEQYYSSIKGWRVKIIKIDSFKYIPAHQLNRNDSLK